MTVRRSLQIKSAIDRVGAMLLLLALAPLFGVLAIAIKLEDSGPIFFCQDRAGFGGRVFRIVKFRTMVVNADALLDSQGRTLGRRVTRVGKILRRLSVDEIPQLFNILRGEMSFIGPRPVLTEQVPRYTAEQRGRFRMKPGITGLAQINGRNTLPWSRRLQLDVQYCDEWSLWLDLRILLRTVKVVVMQEGIALDRNPDQADDLPRSSGAP